MNAHDEAILQSIMDRAYEQACAEIVGTTAHIIAAQPQPHIDRAIAEAQAAPPAARTFLQCPYCHEWYLLRPEPIALEFDGDMAFVRPGFVEICPRCQYENWAGSWLLVFHDHKEELPAG